ncbi:microsomal signal peptidase [Fomitopsis serialis]|uniref:microsomal signal peptidase n=1 Tax=Fomitopsis serialis TaxID=139415 RepID=UPI002007B8A7|nr:microsomal signal peptidase [Neoantrodia serialis]KAH9920601.1 microsomal signal peptidase [Neoantrodia serialis]
MSANLKDSLLDFFEGKIDFEGQKFVEDITKFTLIAAAVFAFIVGALFQSLRVTLGIFGVASIVLCLVVFPPWPMYNRHPVQWLPTKESKPSS